MSIAEARRVSAWWWLVAACAVALLLVAVATAIWWARTSETRTTSYRVLGDLARIRLDLGAADVDVDGGGGAVEVRRVDRFAFGHPSKESRSVSAGRYRVDAESDTGRRRVRGVTHDDDAPYQVQALSTTGDVTVEGA